MPTVSTPARALASTQPAAAKIEAVPRSVTSAIPEVGCEDTPTMPTMRAADRDEQHAEQTDARCEHATLQGAHVTREDPGHEPGDQHDGRDAAEHECGRQVTIRALDRSSTATAVVLQPAGDRHERAGHRRQSRATVRMPAVATAPAPM